MLAHDPLIVGPPLLFHLLELGLTHHRVEPGTEMLGHAARLADEIADRPHHAWEVLRADDHEGHDRDDQYLAGIDTEHRN